MRNIAEYPITHEEVIKCLKEFQAGLDHERIGDLRGLMLEKAIHLVREDFLNGKELP